MKKLLPLLPALFFSACSEPKIDTTYIHPEPRNVGDPMPTLEIEEEIFYIDMKNINTNKKFALIIGYDRNPEDGKNISEYRSIWRLCDARNGVRIPYAVYDVPRELLYIDSSRNNRINRVAKGFEIEDAIFYEIPECGYEEELKRLLEGKIKI